MNHPIWTVVTENLAEQLSAAQGGHIEPVQLLPHLPLSLSQVEETLDELVSSERVEKGSTNNQHGYIFKDSINKSPHKFAPLNCVYSGEPLEELEYTTISGETRSTVENELALLAEKDIWPAEAVWQHELTYLINNLPSPVTTSEIAGHSRLPFKRVETHLFELRKLGAIHFNDGLGAWQLPSLRYPKAAFDRHDKFIRQFPGAIKEEFEVRLTKGLTAALAILFACLLLAVSAKIQFPLILFGGLFITVIIFFKILKSAPKQPLDI